MKIFWFCTIFVVLFSATISCMSEDELAEFLQGPYECQSSRLCKKANVAEWDYETDLNNATKQQKVLEVTEESAKFRKEIWLKYFQDLQPDKFHNESLKRLAKELKLIGTAILDPIKLKTLTNTTTTMSNIYATAKICPFTKQNCNVASEGLPLDPDLEQILAESRNYNELLYVWREWRRMSGARIKDLYKVYVDLSNEAGRANGCGNYADFWLMPYEDVDFVEKIDRLWQQIEPLYLELHRYVGHKLKQLYGDRLDYNEADGLLPAHVFGNMWAQDWYNLAEYVRPYPNTSAKVNITEMLIKRNYTVLRMFETADEFYQSMGLLSNQISYDTSKGAVIEKPSDGREIVCHASAWDFCDKINYRIKMCTKINFEDFITIHHEMGHIQYYQQYKDQMYHYRDGANPGFHEAIGDTMALSVATPKHLKKINLLDHNYQENHETVINNLMDMALQKIAFLPFGLLVDKWRWDIFNGSVPEDKWNEHWWCYREKYQKIKAPLPRSIDDFDAGAKYHVAANSQYIAYFVAHILQFQFYKSLCLEAGDYDPKNPEKPLHNCDFYGSKRAGEKLRNALVLGVSQHWRNAMGIITNSTEMDAGAILEYFQPLYEFLVDYNSKIN